MLLLPFLAYLLLLLGCVFGWLEFFGVGDGDVAFFGFEDGVGAHFFVAFGCFV